MGVSSVRRQFEFVVCRYRTVLWCVCYVTDLEAEVLSAGIRRMCGGNSRQSVGDWRGIRSVRSSLVTEVLQIL